MTFFELFSNLHNTEFPLFFLILLLSIIALISTRILLKISAPIFFIGFFGLIIGLAIGSFVSSFFTNLPGVAGQWFPPILNIFITIAFFDLFLTQSKSLSRYFFKRLPRNESMIAFSKENNLYVLDTSALIDGRIEKVIENNLLNGKHIVSRLVIKELKKMADDISPIKRLKGRRGLDVLTAINRSLKITVEVEEGYYIKKNVDEVLIEIAKNKTAKLITNDYNLSKIADFTNVQTINISKLAQALKPIIVPGEEFEINVHEKGKTVGQGIGYLDDGTMVIIEKGENFINQTVKIRIEKIHQTTLGNIVFASAV